MRILRWLRSLRHHNPTNVWREQPNKRIDIDLKELTINETRIGDSVNALSWLGTADTFVGGFWLWRRHGIALKLDNTMDLAAIWLLIRESAQYPIRSTSYTGILRHEGNIIDMSSLQTEEGAIATLGLPYFRHLGDDLALYYEQDSGELVVSYDLTTLNKTQLTSILMQAPASISFQRAKKWFGINGGGKGPRTEEVSGGQKRG